MVDGDVLDLVTPFAGRLLELIVSRPILVTDVAVGCPASSNVLQTEITDVIDSLQGGVGGCFNQVSGLLVI